MGKLTDCYVEINTKDKLDAGLNAAKGKLEGFARQAASFGAISLGVAAGAGIAGLAGFLKGAVDEASKLAETTNKIQVAFGGSAGTVQAWAQQMADKFGLVKSTTMDAVAGFGLMAQGMGMTKSESASFSTTLGQVAADVTSLYNVPLPEVLEKIRSGLAGEAEPLRQFGVNLTAAAVESHALEMGLASGKKELSDYALMVSRADLIIKGLAQAQGDLEATSDSLSNRQRKLAGDFTNMQAAIGAELLDPMRDLITAVYELGGALDGTFGGDRASQMKSLGAFAQSFADSFRYLIDGNPLAGLEEGLLSISVGVFGNTFGDQDRLFKLRSDRAQELARKDDDAKKAAKGEQADKAKADAAKAKDAEEKKTEKPKTLDEWKTAAQDAEAQAGEAEREVALARERLADKLNAGERAEWEATAAAAQKRADAAWAQATKAQNRVAEIEAKAKDKPPGWKPGDGDVSPEAAAKAAERKAAADAEKKIADAEREAKHAVDEAKRKVKQIEEDARSPAEKFTRDRDEAHALLQRGDLGPVDYVKYLSKKSGVDDALQKAQDQVADLESPRRRQLTGAVYGDLLSANSAMMQQSLDGGIPQQQLEQAKKQVELLAGLREDIRNDKPGAYDQLQFVLKGRE
jgi:hypothetical protein